MSAGYIRRSEHGAGPAKRKNDRLHHNVGRYVSAGIAVRPKVTRAAPAQVPHAYDGTITHSGDGRHSFGTRSRKSSVSCYRLCDNPHDLFLPEACHAQARRPPETDHEWLSAWTGCVGCRGRWSFPRS